MAKSKKKAYKRAYSKKRYAKMVKKMGQRGKLGAGGRFAAIEAKARKYGATNPAAVAAAVGIRKYGKQKMLAMARKARMKKSAHPGRGFIAIKVK